MKVNKELRINCSFYPGKYRDQVRQLLENEQVALCRHIYERLHIGPGQMYSLQTQVIGAADQRFSHDMCELNLDLVAYPSEPALQTGIGADELLDSLQRAFPNLAGVGVQVTYLSGIVHSSWNQARRAER